MEILRELEASCRGPYCGAIGYFSPDGSAQFNVAIRTLTISGNRGELGLGGGVVQDSGAKNEYDECLLKARFFEAGRKPLELIETLRWQGGFSRGATIARIDGARLGPVQNCTFSTGARFTILLLLVSLPVRMIPSPASGSGMAHMGQEITGKRLPSLG